MKHLKLYESFVNESDKKYGIAVFSRDYKAKPSSNNAEVKSVTKYHKDFKVVSDDYTVDDSILTIVTNYPSNKLADLPDFSDLWEPSYNSDDSIVWFNNPKELSKFGKGDNGSAEELAKEYEKLGREFAKTIGLKKGDKLKFRNGDYSSTGTFVKLGSSGTGSYAGCSIEYKPDDKEEGNVYGTTSDSIDILVEVNGKKVKFEHKDMRKKIQKLRK